MSEPAPIDRNIDRMQAVRQEILDLVASLDPETIETRPVVGEWTVRQVLIHLADAEKAHRRYIQGLIAGTLTTTAADAATFDINRWNAGSIARRDAETVAEALVRLAAERETTLAFLPTIPDDAWAISGIHPALGELSVLAAVKVIGLHEKMHLKEMRDGTGE